MFCDGPAGTAGVRRAINSSPSCARGLRRCSATVRGRRRDRRDRLPSSPERTAPRSSRRWREVERWLVKHELLVRPHLELRDPGHSLSCARGSRRCSATARPAVIAARNQDFRPNQSVDDVTTHGENTNFGAALESFPDSRRHADVRVLARRLCPRPWRNQDLRPNQSVDDVTRHGENTNFGAAPGVIGRGTKTSAPIKKRRRRHDAQRDHELWRRI